MDIYEEEKVIGIVVCNSCLLPTKDEIRVFAILCGKGAKGR